MKFLSNIIGKKREEAEAADARPAISIETLQRDLDHSDLDGSLRGLDAAWNERVVHRGASDPEPDDAPETAGAPDRRTVSRDLEWEDELGDAGDAELREAYDAPRARHQTRPVVEEDTASDDDDGFDEFDEDDFDEDEFDELDPEEEQAIRDNALLVDEIRDAIAAVRHIEGDEPRKAETRKGASAENKGWENDEVFGRKAIARDRLARLAESEDGDRILEETNHKMFDDDAATRRRQAMAHLKAAAAATKADRVLKRVVGRDPAMDPDHQVQYREDLANVVRSRGPRSEPISRPLSRPRSRPVTREVSQIVPAAPAEPMTYEQLREAFSRTENAKTAAAEQPAATAASLPEDSKPVEAKMDVEKIDLKTALERQKAILKAEREALEAEIAKPTPEVAEDDFEDDIEPEVEPEVEIEEPGEDVGQELEARVEVDRDEAGDTAEDDADFDDWDDGLAEEHDEEEAEPVSAAADDHDEEIEDEEEDEPAHEEPVRDLRLDAMDVQPAPEAAAAPAGRKAAGRVKTRLLGFQSKADTRDVFAGKAAQGAGAVRFPVGWLVITKGEGFGHSFALLSGVSKIGRGDDQAVQLDFGDTAISRDNHAAIAFDEELNQFFLGHGGKSNVVRLNGVPVLSTEELYDGDEIRIGETTLKFIALCGEEFSWAGNAGDDNDHARSA